MSNTPSFKTKIKRNKDNHLVQTAEILDGIDVGFFSLDPDWRFIHVNKRAASILGFKPKDLFEQNFWDKFPKLKGTELELNYRKSLEKEQPQEFEWFCTLNNKWYNIRVYPSEEGISACWRDVTELKKVDEDLKKTEESLKETQDLGRIGSWEYDLEKQTITWSAETYLLYERDPSLGPPSTEEDSRYYSPMQYKTMMDRVTEALETGETVSYDIEVKLPSGKPAFYHATIHPIKNTLGRVVKVYGVVQDITQRRQVEEKIKDSERKYRSLFENMTEGFVLGEIILDKTGVPCDLRLLEVNKAWEKMTHIPSKKAASRTYSELFQQPLEDFIQKLGKVALTGETTTFELYSSNLNIWLSIYAYSPENGKFASISTDITDRKQAEEALKESEEKYRSLFSSMSEAFVILEFILNEKGEPVDFVIIDANPVWEKQTGLRLEQVKGKRATTFLPTVEPIWFDWYRKVMNTDQPQWFESFRPATKKWLEVLGYRVHGKNRIAVLFSDISERKKAEEALAKVKDELEIKVKERTEQLQTAFDETIQSQKELKAANRQLKQYANKITQVQEEERKRIAYELHDDTAQYLSILKMQIGALANSEEIQSHKLKERLQFLEKDADRAFQDVRRYSHELRPVVLEHHGLVAALEQIAEDFNKLGQLTVEVHIKGMELELSEETKLGIFRIAQEAINNTRKHAKASQVNIDIRFNRMQVKMIVSDNGDGFNTKQALKTRKEKGSLGLMSMHERADLINADLKIESEPGKGTKVILKVKI